MPVCVEEVVDCEGRAVDCDVGAVDCEGTLVAARISFQASKMRYISSRRCIKYNNAGKVEELTRRIIRHHNLICLRPIQARYKV